MRVHGCVCVGVFVCLCAALTVVVLHEGRVVAAERLLALAPLGAAVLEPHLQHDAACTASEEQIVITSLQKLSQSLREVCSLRACSIIM